MLASSPAIDRLFQALGDPTRRAILERLSERPASASTLVKSLKMSLAAVVQHLQVLEACGLARTEKVGRVRTCQLEVAGLNLAEQWLSDRRAVWEGRYDRLGQLLAEEGEV